ncbi:ribbon-helix-helix protein, CopG family [Mesoaciditoga lauensis]|uniref:ribbon-helix-helix protein, CopG family n=1 Tax=Mesoaciditoga lauensis TaxID=1495039 RepID=UPI000567281C|nr:ribbon-helix-helix protein, CopG family [Mesoaciditoga lauensis]
MLKFERHNITMDSETWKILEELKRIQNKSISEIIREAIKELLKNHKYNKVYFKLMANTPFCDEEENEELTKILDLLNEDDLKIVDEYELHR